MKGKALLLMGVVVLGSVMPAGLAQAGGPLLETLTGKPFDVAALPKGDLIVFWHPDCAYCLQELKHLGSSQDSALLAHTATIALLPHDSVRQGKYMLPEATLNLASRGNPADVLERFGNPDGVLPYAVITHADGSLCQQLAGIQSESELHKALSACQQH